MAVFNNMVITTKGEALYNKVQAGKPLNFTKMKIGSGQLATGDDPTTFTALKQYAFDVSISSITPNTVLKVAVISGTINNNNITEGKYICELGLFANDPDEGEILYGYATAGTEGDWIAPSSKGAFAWNYQINAAVGNAQDVTATVSSTTFDYAVASTSTTFAIISGNNQKEINDSIDTTIGLIKNTVNFEVGSFTATADNTTSFQISSPYNPDTDHVELFYKGNDRMELGDNYTLNGTQVSLVGWSLLTGEKITYNIWKFVNHVPIMADGSNLQNGSVAERSLTQDIQDKIESVPESTGYGVISGLGVTAQSTPNMSVLVNSGRAHMPVSSKRVNLTSSTTIPITASDALKPRTDIVYINASGVPSYLASGLGTAAVAGTRNYTINTNAKVAVAGSNTYTISTNFASGDTVVFDGVTFTAVASGATGAQFNVGADYMISATNLASTLNTNSTINDNFTATANSNIVTIAERTAGNGDTPGTMTTTGTGVITAGTATTSTPADTVTINGVTFTAVASNATSNQFDVGGDTTATATNLVSALNANSTISGLYTANSSTNIITLIEKVAGGGNTPTVATTTGTVSIVSGTATNSTAQIYPTAPTTPDGGMLLYDIKVGAGATAITNLDLIDKRIFKLNNNQLASQMADIVYLLNSKIPVDDWTDILQNLCNIANTNGGTVKIPAGIYKIYSDVHLNCDIICDGFIELQNNARILIDNANGKYIQLKFKNGGIDINSQAVCVTHSYRCIFSIEGEGYLGTLWNVYGIEGASNPGYNLVQRISSLNCGRAIQHGDGNYIDTFGTYVDIWDILSSEGSIFQHYSDVTILHYENAFAQQGSSLSFKNGMATHIGILALGGSADTLLDIFNCNNMFSIEKLFCTRKDYAKTAVNVTQITDLQISNCVINGHLNGIMLDSTSNVKIPNAYITSTNKIIKNGSAITDKTNFSLFSEDIILNNTQISIAKSGIKTLGSIQELSYTDKPLYFSNYYGFPLQIAIVGGDTSKIELNYNSEGWNNIGITTGTFILPDNTTMVIWWNTVKPVITYQAF